MGKNSKRPKSYYINESKRKKNYEELKSNMVGFLCTGNREKECLKEAYNLLNEFADSLYGKEDSARKHCSTETDDTQSQSSSQKLPPQDNQNASESEEETIESALKDELEALQKSSQSDKSSRRFQQISARVNNCVFISTTVQDPLELSVAIMEDILKQQKVRTQHLFRMIPVQKTCRAFLEDIEKTAKELICERFPKCKTTFYISFRARNNNSVRRDVILKNFLNIIKDFNQEAEADYKVPELVVNVEILKHICCLSILPHYFTKYCKYNLLKLVQSEETSEEKPVEKTDASANQTEPEVKLVKKTDASANQTEPEEVKPVEKTDISANQTEPEVKLVEKTVTSANQTELEEDKPVEKTELVTEESK